MPEQTLQPCFIICPIGDEGGASRERSDLIFNYVVRPVCEEKGFAPARADHIQQGGVITMQIIERLLGDPLVIADLTEQNANVFYELAIRHATRKPCIQMIAKGHRIPFDVVGMRTVEINEHDLKSVDAAKVQLREMIQWFIEHPEAQSDSPISMAVDFLALKGSSNPALKGYGELHQLLNEVRAEVGALSTRMLATQLLAGEVRDLTNSMAARELGVADSTMLAAVMDAAGLLQRFRGQASGRDKAELDSAEHALRKLALRFMGSQLEPADAPATGRARSSRHGSGSRPRNRRSKKKGG